MVSIYALINSLDNNVFYIGATKNPYSRHYSHISGSKKLASKKDYEIVRILKEGGSIDFLILDEVRPEHARYWEDFYMDLYSFYGFSLLQVRKSLYSARPLPVDINNKVEKECNRHKMIFYGKCYAEFISVSGYLPLKYSSDKYYALYYYLRDQFISCLNFVRITYGLEGNGFIRKDFLTEEEMLSIKQTKEIIRKRINKKINTYNGGIPICFRDYDIFNN